MSENNFTEGFAVGQGMNNGCGGWGGDWIAILDGPLQGVHQLDEYGAIPGAKDGIVFIRDSVKA